MSTVDHGSGHLWTGDSPSTVRCAYMFCDAKPSKAELERLEAEVEAARRVRRPIEFRPPGRRT
jgi:hypothetical protein